MYFSICRFLRAFFLLNIVMITVANAQTLPIIPQPVSIQIQNGSFSVTKNTKICYADGLEKEAKFLQKLFDDEHHIKLKIEKNKGATKNGNIYLLQSEDVAAKHSKEGYTMNVADKITIEGGAAPGVFYGIQTLRQILQRKNGDTQVSIPQVTIADKPRFEWRAFMLDEGRYFKGEEVVKQLLDEMALLKMNTFHWHLTDDTGWRIEIKKYPKLTEIGSTRKESEMGTWLSDKMDGKVHSGFYTQEKLKEIIQYAADRHIKIIPEIEMPGHASAAIASYPWLSAENKQIEVPTKFRIQLNVFNVANPKVIQFIHDVLDEVMAVFPSNIVHIGGDEVKYDQWKQSAEVNQYMKKNNIQSPADLQIHFTNGISNYIAKKNHRMMGWNEILGGHSTMNDSLDAHAKQTLSNDVIIHFWTGDPATVSRAAESGYDVVNSRSEYTYLDYDYETTSLEKAYSFDPIPETLPANLHSKVLGLGCQMWGEWIPTVESMNEKIYPRIAAFSEIGWSKKEDKNFTRFSTALPVYLTKHWKVRGIVFPENVK